MTNATKKPKANEPEKIAKPVKKPYEKPRLETYGNIREIAQAASLMGMMDNAIGVFRSQ